MNMQFKSICVALALVAAPLTAQAVPITYDIGSGSAPGFSGSWLHAGTTQMGSSGYFANGAKAGISGSLTLDMDSPVSASGLLSGVGNFGLGNDTWSINITGGASSALPTFVDDEGLLLSLNYDLTSVGGHSSSGTFYFADFDFNNNAADGGPNLINDDNLYLWGNNWINENGASDRGAFVAPIQGPDFSAPGNIALGLDLYGTATTVPEPGVLAMLAIGLVGIGVSRRIVRS